MLKLLCVAEVFLWILFNFDTKILEFAWKFSEIVLMLGTEIF